MLENLDIQGIKNKLALTLSMAFTDCNIGIDNISESLLTHPLFDCFENNDLENFCKYSSDVLTKDVFGKNILEHRDVSAELYWAGMEYCNISFNCNLPLKQVVLLCPLREMVAAFGVYHEMADERMVDKYLQENAKRSILKALRKKCNYSVRELSILTGIPEQTIKYYEKDNRNFFAASFSNVELLSEALGYSKDIYKEKSSFVPITRSMFEIEKFRTEIEHQIGELEKKENVKLIYDELAIGYTHIYKGRIMKEYINEKDLTSLTLKVFRETLKYEQGKEKRLVF